VLFADGAVAAVDTDDSLIGVGLLSAVSISSVPVATCNVSKCRITLLNWLREAASKIGRSYKP
jgi:hypothetical protein